MTSLADALQHLVGVVSTIPAPPFTGILILDVPPGLELDHRGRLKVARSMLREPKSYEDRFNELAASLPWINLSAYGILNGMLIVGVEHVPPQMSARERPAVVNYSGPTRRVVEQNWDVEALLAIEDT
jgi:hypothetical protein